MNDLPLEFHSTRQMLSVLKARGMYYDTLPRHFSKKNVLLPFNSGSCVPPLSQNSWSALSPSLTVSQVNSIGSHVLTLPYFGSLGEFFLFLLARKLTSIDGAIAAIAFYLFLPYAIIASRSFQPDPLMIMLIIIFWWAIYEWAFSSPKNGMRAWQFAILAGLFGGLAIFIKFVAAFFVIGGGVGALLLGRRPLIEVLRKPLVYIMSTLGIIPGAAYAIYGVFIAGILVSNLADDLSHLIF